MRTMGPFVPVDDGPGLLALVGGRGPGTARRHLRPAAARGQGPLQAAGGDGRRPLRELPARHHGALGPRSRRPAGRRSSTCASASSDRAGPTPRGPAWTGWASPSAGSSTSRATPTARRCGPASPCRTTSPVPSPPSRPWRALRRDAARGQAATGCATARSSTRRCTAPSCASSSGRWPGTTGSASCANARATGSRTRPPSTTTRRPTASSSASWPAPTPTSPACAPPWADPTWRSDPRFATLAERAARGDEINGIVAEWTSGLTAEEITARCVEHDVPIGTAYSAADIFADPHMARPRRPRRRRRSGHRPGAPAGTVPASGEQPDPGSHRGAPRLGEHNHEVWCDLVGLSDDELADLTARGVV